MLTKQRRGARVTKRMSSEERRRQIIGAATDLFSQHGYEKVTVRQIAEACHVTEPALYRYFASKDNIFEAVILALKSRLDLDALFAGLKDETEIEPVLRGMALFIVRTYGRHQELQRLLFLISLKKHPLARTAFRELRQPYVEFLVGKLRELIKAGKIREVHPVITARCFVGMVMECALGMHLWKEYQVSSYEPERVVDNNVPIYARGLGIETTRTKSD